MVAVSPGRGFTGRPATLRLATGELVEITAWSAVTESTRIVATVCPACPTQNSNEPVSRVVIDVGTNLPTDVSPEFKKIVRGPASGCPAVSLIVTCPMKRE